MGRMAAVIALGAAVVLPLPQDGVEADKAAIRQAVLDYAEGYYGHAPDRMERAISPLLSKRGLNLRPGLPILQQNAEMLIDACRGTAPRPGPDERKMTVEALDVQPEIASARVFSVQFNDYIHLLKRGGRWQLLSVLWHQPPASPGAPDATAAAGAAVKDFAGALAGNDGKAASKLLYPVALVRMLAPSQDGGRLVRDLNPETIAAGLSGGQAFLQAKPDEIQTRVLGVDGDLASGLVTAQGVTLYVHLGLIDGRWQVVNALGFRPLTR
jgi:Putative lumazine-binding